MKVKTGQDAGRIEHVDYRPPVGYSLDLEVMRIAELRRRGSPEHFALPQRAAFHLLIGVTGGECEHMLDFVGHGAREGSWLMVNPGQVQRFDFSRDWSGWLLVFRAEFLPSGWVGGIPGDESAWSHVRLAASTHRAALNTVEQMSSDASEAGSFEGRTALLRAQLQGLLWRLCLAARAGAPPSPPQVLLAQRFARFRQAVETDLAQPRAPAEYAARQGCAERTLNRACLAVVGVSAKQYIVARRILEAKRLLAHTAQPVQRIADVLGFDEASNFVKYFRRAEGCTPGVFRQRYVGRGAE